MQLPFSKTSLAVLTLVSCVTPAFASPVSSAAFDSATDLMNTVVVQAASLGGGLNDPRYLPPVTSAVHAGVVNLWFRDATGAVTGACTGSMLTNRTVLTAAHCVASNSATVRHDSFTARFRNPDGSVTEINGHDFRVQAGYSGAVVEEQDVAVLTLSDDAPLTARTYTLFNGNPLQNFNIAGYGRIGDGNTGDLTSSGQFNTTLNVLRGGRNRFETTGNDGAFYATISNPDPGAFGGVLRADMDRVGTTTHPATFMCAALGFCDLGLGLDEVAVGRGDSGGAAFTDTWEVLGVASWGQGSQATGLGRYNTSFGYACVANYAPNAVCVANYNFVMSNLVVSEPASLSLAGLGLLGLAALRRRRSC